MTDALAAPELIDDVIHGVRVFERLTRFRGRRRASPFESSWVEVYRGVDRGRVVMLLCARPDLREGDDVAALQRAIADDARGWMGCGWPGVARVVLNGAAFPASVDVEDDDPGVSYAVLTDVPGVRLRAIVDATVAEGALLPAEVALDVCVRTAELIEALHPLRPADTIVGWDGALTLLPRALACVRAETPRLTGTEIFDGMVLTGPGMLREVFGAPPPEIYGLVVDAAAEVPRGLPPAVARLASAEQAAPFRDRAAGALEELGRPPPRLLGDIARRLFPEIHQRQRDVLEDLER